MALQGPTADVPVPDQSGVADVWGSQARLSGVGAPTSPALLMEAMLVACGEIGYREVEPDRLYSGDELTLFRELFASKESCFAGAYAARAQRLDRLLAIAGEEGRVGGELLEVALTGLGRFIATHTMAARGVLVEVHVAGAGASRERARFLHASAKRLDGAFGETGPQGSGTGYFLVTMIESVAGLCCLSHDPEYFLSAVPELAAMVEEAYAGSPGA